MAAIAEAAHPFDYTRARERLGVVSELDISKELSKILDRIDWLREKASKFEGDLTQVENELDRIELGFADLAVSGLGSKIADVQNSLMGYDEAFYLNQDRGEGTFIAIVIRSCKNEAKDLLKRYKKIVRAHGSSSDFLEEDDFEDDDILI